MPREDLKELPIIKNQKKLIEYLRITIAQSSKESFYVIYLNKKSQVIDEYSQDVTMDKNPLYGREVIKRALLIGATAMVIAHNHPGESIKPSQHDISLTKTL